MSEYSTPKIFDSCSPNQDQRALKDQDQPVLQVKMENVHQAPIFFD